MTMRTLVSLTADKALGLAGGGLALASASFALYMGLNNSVGAPNRDFTVFAQLAPRAPAKPATMFERGRPDPDEDLDTAVTASIPRRATISAGPVSAGPERGLGRAGGAAADRSPSPAVTLQTAAADGATIAVDGQSRVVHVGDTIPGAGEVLAILPGAHPAVRTSQGLIVATDGR